MGRTEQQQQPRMTLGGYLDMSRSLNMDPMSRSRHSNGARKWDMTKSLNVESGFFSKSMARSKKHSGSSGSSSSSTTGGRVAAAKSFHSPVLEEEEERPAVAKPSPLSGVKDKAFPSRASFHTGLNGKVLPASPNIRDSGQEKELIEAFVDQLRSIAASSSSSEPNATTRRVVRRALEFSSSLMTTATPEHSSKNKEGSSRGGGGGEGDLPGKMYRSKVTRNGGGGVATDLRRRQFLPMVVDDKQTVISSPICHSSSSSARIKLKSVDMAPAIQQHAIECAIQLLKNMNCKLNCKLVAWQLKKEFDKIHGPAWHCIVGTSFGSYVTHSVGGFVYFAVGKVSILLFRTAIEVVDKK